MLLPRVHQCSWNLLPRLQWQLLQGVQLRRAQECQNNVGAQAQTPDKCQSELWLGELQGTQANGPGVCVQRMWLAGVCLLSRWGAHRPQKDTAQHLGKLSYFILNWFGTGFDFYRVKPTNWSLMNWLTRLKWHLNSWNQHNRWVFIIYLLNHTKHK